MKSTDNTINNPTRKVELDPYLVSNHTEVMQLTQDEYDAMSKHDPTCVYLIDDGTAENMYLGDQKIPVVSRSSKYLLSCDPETDHFEMYLNLVTNGHDNLIKVGEYKEAVEALHALGNASSKRSHAEEINALCTVLEMYRDREIGIHELILSLFTIKGWNNDPRFQILIEKAKAYGVDNSSDLPTDFKLVLHNLKSHNPGSLTALYSDLYDIIVQFNWLENADEHTVAEALTEVCKCINVFTLL